MKFTKLMNNFYEIDIANLRIWISYETVIGYCLSGLDPIVSTNKWGNTTGKHINYIKNNYTEIIFMEHDDFTEVLNDIINQTTFQF